jgi:hypothetical protein
MAQPMTDEDANPIDEPAKRKPRLSEHGVHSLILVVALLAIAVDIFLDRQARHERDVMQLRHSEDQAELRRKAVEASTAAIQANSLEIRKLDATMQEVLRKRDKP